ncbi:YvcK family protein [Listeria booriae]|uniref:gluconeogenesis factor YvcK family protein n=1 Tax=Listeria booriae TaxID=1552123 RepID=UPI001626D651|nr:YvcK family protein [Listeria booriae]MBC1211369.1 YvcK family protein [Listeria booriae]
MTTTQKPKVVVIGGGTGLPVILLGLKKQPIDLTAIVTVADDGGSSGKIREQMDVLPPGDIRNVMVALSNTDPRMEALMQYRFKVEGDLSGHVIGNLILTALSQLNDSYVEAIEVLSKAMRIRGKVIPATDKPLILNAIMEDGSLVQGESVIPMQGQPIDRVFITPEDVKALPAAIEAIHDADLIVLGPGSLYTSILPSLLVQDLQDAIFESKAYKVYICNILTQVGETDFFTDADHAQVILNHVGRPIIDAMMINTAEVPRHLMFPDDVLQVSQDFEKDKKLNINVIAGDLLSTEGGLVRHAADKVTNTLLQILMNLKEKE